MTINETLVKLVEETNNKYFLYVSKSDAALNDAFNHCLVNIDLNATTSRPIFVRPEGVKDVQQSISAVFVERGIGIPPTPPNLTIDAVFSWVDPETKEISE